MAQQVVNIGTNPNDGTGEALRSAVSKFNSNFTEVYALQSQTINAGAVDYDFSGATDEQRIQLAINDAVLRGFDRVYVPAFMSPYNVDQVTFSDTVKMVREGGVAAGGVWDAAAYGGKVSSLAYTEHGYSIREAAKACAANGGGTVDCQGFPSNAVIVLATDICGLLATHETSPITFVWGAHEIRVKATQSLRSHHHHTLFGGTFISKDENGTRVLATTMFNETGLVPVTITTTDGSGVVVKDASAGWARLEVGSPLVIHGRVPPLGSDNTTINVGGGIDGVTQTITVVSTTGFATTGGLGANVIRIEDEIITYTSVNATQFLNCTRGAMGTTAAAHANSTRVDRVTYEPFYVKSISGSNLTLDHGQTMDLAATALLAFLGPLDISFGGFGTFDGNQDPSADDAGNPQGILVRYGRNITVTPGLRFKNFNHGAIDCECCQDFFVDVDVTDCGFPSLAVGWGVVLFGRQKRFTVQVDGADCAVGVVVVDDRSSSPQVTDGPAEDGYVLVRRWKGTGSGNESGIAASGSQRCKYEIGPSSNVSATGIGISLTTAQWVTNTAGVDNVCIAHPMSAPGGGTLINVDSSYANKPTTVISYMVRPILITPDGVTVVRPTALHTLTYGVTVTPVPNRATHQVISITDGVAFTIANPASTQRGNDLVFTLEIQNNHSAAHGTITMGGEYMLEGGGTTLPAIANGKRRYFSFRRNGSASKWIAAGQSAADIS